MSSQKKPVLHRSTDVPRDPFQKRREMTWHEQLVWLLHLGAAMEHSLMAQYLYAGYSLGGPLVPREHHIKVKGWQDSILAVAREEMGHLLTVQNVLTFLGAGFNLSRDQFPWPIEWFNIEPFCMGSLACYVNAEMPENEKFDEREEIEKLVAKHLGKNTPPVHPVAEIYRQVMELLADSNRIPESALHPESYSMQASWDEWGRGYKPDPRPLDAAGNLEPTAEARSKAQFDSHVLVFKVATRTEAIAALKQVSLQGEGKEDMKEVGVWTHFRRFIQI
ncbi:MAG TPA: ferritin-like domain-containing protein, partial [Acidobacteriaceae bacterium]|nr:ferritin-like domain-containing protein [Acidobacteriaceae bacterium]